MEADTQLGIEQSDIVEHIIPALDLRIQYLEALIENTKHVKVQYVGILEFMDEKNIRRLPVLDLKKINPPTPVPSATAGDLTEAIRQGRAQGDSVTVQRERPSKPLIPPKKNTRTCAKCGLSPADVKFKAPRSSMCIKCSVEDVNLGKDGGIKPLSPGNKAAEYLDTIGDTWKRTESKSTDEKSNRMCQRCKEHRDWQHFPNSESKICFVCLKEIARAREEARKNPNLTMMPDGN